MNLEQKVMAVVAKHVFYSSSLLHSTNEWMNELDVEEQDIDEFDMDFTAWVISETALDYLDEMGCTVVVYHGICFWLDYSQNVPLHQLLAWKNITQKYYM